MQYDTIKFNALTELVKRFNPKSYFKASFSKQDVMVYIIETFKDEEMFPFLAHFSRKAISEETGVDFEEVSFTEAFRLITKSVNKFNARSFDELSRSGSVACREVIKSIKSGILKEAIQNKKCISEKTYNETEPQPNFTASDKVFAQMLKERIVNIEAGKTGGRIEIVQPVQEQKK